MPQVLFAGYKVPHPLHPYFLLKVQTDGSISPRDALEEAAMKLIVKIQHMEQGFKNEFALKSTDGTGAAVGGGDEPYGAGSGSTWNAGRGYMDF
jgi:DNA-directed RNA polymerase II subunit RPB11